MKDYLLLLNKSRDIQTVEEHSQNDVTQVGEGGLHLSEALYEVASKTFGAGS